jgi:hypothetical protein
MKQYTSLLQHLQLGFSVITSVWFRPAYFHHAIVPQVADEANAASIFRATRTAARIISVCAYITSLSIYTLYHKYIIIGEPLLALFFSAFVFVLGDFLGYFGYRRFNNEPPRSLRLVALSFLFPLCFAIVASSALLLRIWLGPTYYRGTDIPVPLYLASAFPIGIPMLFLMMMLYHVPPEPPRRRHMFQLIAIFFIALLWATLIILHGLHPILGYGSYTPFSRQWLNIYFGLQAITFGVSIVLGRCLNPSTLSTSRQ